MIQDGMPHGSSCGDLSAYAVQLEELMDNLKAQMEQRIRLRKEITQKIEEMPDENGKDCAAAAIYPLVEVGTDRGQNGVQLETDT